jgi:hypothetical protein
MTWARYAGEATGIEGEIWSGRIFTPRFYCDDPTMGPVGIYATKPPVCHLILSPRVQYLGEAIDWDISPSGSATSTISTYTINFGGGGVANISGASWSGSKTGSATYNAVGTYTVEAFVTDLLGTESQHVFITVEIVEPVERLYIGTSDSGVFISDNGATPTASNSGLSGDDLDIRAIRVHPAYAGLPPGQQHVWLVTKTGLAYSTNGGSTWTTISEATLGTPTNGAADDPAPTASGLDQIDLAFDPQDDRRLYVVRFTTSPRRAWLYMSDDYGANWSNTQVSI